MAAVPGYAPAVDALGGSPGGQRRTASWEEFVEASYPMIWRFCAALVGGSAADDLAQETFLRATRALPQFRGQASGRTWILSIARRTCMDHLRVRYRRERRDHRLTHEPFSRHVPDASGDLATRDLLIQLEPDRRIAFVLTQLFELSYEEAASVCDCPIGTIRSRVARARNDLIGLIEAAPAASPRHAAE
jgi:RNA polymerase sigma-70 factor (ECF subfamily)